METASVTFGFYDDSNSGPVLCFVGLALFCLPNQATAQGSWLK